MPLYNYFNRNFICFHTRLNNLNVHYAQFSSSTSKMYVLQRFISRPVELAYTSYAGDMSCPVIIMHGLLGSRNNWNSIAKAIKAKTGRQIYTIDARNHGQSPHTAEMSYWHMAADLKLFITKHQAINGVVLGHSMGGRAAMLLALTEPDIMDKLVVVDISPLKSSPNLGVMGTYFQALKDLQIPSEISLSEARNLADTQLASAISNKSIRQFLLMNLDVSVPGSIWKANLLALEKNFIENIAKFPEFPPAAVFSKSALFIAGKQSDYILPEDVEDIKTLFPQAVFKFIDGAGHWVHADQPSVFISTLCDFLSPKF